MTRSRTLVSFHAHPDDEALLTGGTLARAVAEGHRVVVVVATAGEQGLADASHRATGLGGVRLGELEVAAATLGVHRVEVLGYADSGWPARDAPADAFSRADPELVAEQLARILLEEDADVLTSYDAAGGYGHPDHLQVHRVGVRAARLAHTPVVLEATVDRRALLRATAPLRGLARVLPLPDIPDLTEAYTAPEEITHVIDVRAHLAAKRRALAAHASQATADDGGRTLGLLLRLPAPLARRALGREWFREVGRTPGPRRETDVFAGLA